ncbi:unnamed protein product, partial [Iphiclides podalirius]
MSASQSTKKRKTWDEEKMAEAIKFVRGNKMGYLKAAQNFERKAAIATVITSSPYKNYLVNKNMKRQEKESKTKNKKKTAKRKQQTKKNRNDREEEDSEERDVIQFDEDSEHDELMDQVSPDSADAECMFCSNLFSMDKSGES